MSGWTAVCCTATAAVLLCLGLGACDAVSTVAQPVDLQVLDRRTMEPVHGATVAPAVEPTSRYTRAPGWMGTTNEQGAVRININTTYLQGGVSGWLFDRPTKDRLTGTAREFAVVWNDIRDHISISMEADQVAMGEHLLMRIDSIHRPFEWRLDDPDSRPEERGENGSGE